MKRGFGSFDAGKRSVNSARHALPIRLAEVLWDFQGSRCLRDSCSRHFLLWIEVAPSALAITGRELDEHFNWPIYAAMEEVNDLYKRRLFEILAA